MPASSCTLDDMSTRLVAIGAILVLTAVNYLGVALGGRVQSAFTFVKVAAVAVIIAIGALLSGEVTVNNTWSLDAISGGNFLLAVGAGLFAFGGWHMVTYTAEETVDPTRTIPRSLMIGIVVVTLCYVGLNAVYLRVLPIDKVIASQRVAADAFDVLVGSRGAGVISALVMFSAFGALNGIVLLGPRVYYQMALDGLWFKWARDVHPRFQTPGKALLLQGVWASVLVWTGTYRALFTRVIYTEWIFFALLALGVRAAAPSARLSAGVAHAARAADTARLHRGLSGHRRQSNCRRSAASGDGSWHCRHRIPCVLPLGPPPLG